LFEEPENLMKQELREPAVYNAVITAIANGATRQMKLPTGQDLTEISVQNISQFSVILVFFKRLNRLSIHPRENLFTV
ncbi:MAG: hypothetical protein IKF75_06875, partial [Lachnospiraceae bacterium]|nr:hypothetical protein [Lachnospiraceae bacterium]